MTLERRNPIPPGIYQLDVVRKNLAAFLEWRKDNRDAVKVRKTEDNLGNVADVATGAPSGFIPVWFLFEVSNLRPVFWEATKFGFPSTAPQGLSTNRVPGFEPEKDALDQIADALPRPETTIRLVVWGGAALLAFLIYRELKG